MLLGPADTPARPDAEVAALMRTNLFDNGSDQFEEPGHAAISCIVMAETLKAAKIDAGNKQLWVPLSILPKRSLEVVKANSRTRNCVTLLLPEWFAKKEGLI
jgi:hypothetical protein